MQQIDLPCGNAEHQPCIFHIDHHDPFTRAQRSTGTNFQTVNASAFRGKSQPFYQPGGSEDQGNNGDAWLFITNGSGGASARTG